jgi:hypothetical protein
MLRRSAATATARAGWRRDWNSLLPQEKDSQQHQQEQDSPLTCGSRIGTRRISPGGVARRIHQALLFLRRQIVDLGWPGRPTAAASSCAQSVIASADIATSVGGLLPAAVPSTGVGGAGGVLPSSIIRLSLGPSEVALPDPEPGPLV